MTSQPRNFIAQTFLASTALVELFTKMKLCARPPQIFEKGIRKIREIFHKIKYTFLCEVSIYQFFIILKKKKKKNCADKNFSEAYEKKKKNEQFFIFLKIGLMVLIDFFLSLKQLKF